MLINKDDWLLELVCGRWRFIDHENKLLSHGWVDEEEADLDSVSLKDHMVEDYQLNYLDFISN